MLRPADGVNNRRRLFHVSILANGREKVGSAKKLVPRYAGNPLDHLRRVTRILLFQQLEHAARILERQVVCDLGRKRGCCRGARLATGISDSLIFPCGFIVATPPSTNPQQKPSPPTLDPLLPYKRIVRFPP